MTSQEKSPVLKETLFWGLAIIITLFAAHYQRTTGPTYPITGTVSLDGMKISYYLHRSHGGVGDQPVEIQVPDTLVEGILEYRHYPTDESWTSEKLVRKGRRLVGTLPHQPPAGKLEYRVILKRGDVQISIPPKEAAVIRFKGMVPHAVLFPHIFFMFLAMLFSTRAGLEALFNPDGRLKTYTYWTVGLLAIGGFILGPLVQKFAFGALWTGIPFGWDLTDNKTLIALAGWVIALIAVIKKGRKGRWWVVFASLIMIVIFLIPHSMHGSELKYDEAGHVIRNHS
ncbi:MAG: hypothetical protein GXO76_04960 [Calditrichaeota bacterium]|nr:hypothetical protein [Calditrichota bacterium]